LVVGGALTANTRDSRVVSRSALTTGAVVVSYANYAGYSKSDYFCNDVTPELFSVPLDLEGYSINPRLTPPHLKSVQFMFIKIETYLSLESIVQAENIRSWVKMRT